MRAFRPIQAAPASSRYRRVVAPMILAPMILAPMILATVLMLADIGSNIWAPDTWAASAWTSRAWARGGLGPDPRLSSRQIEALPDDIRRGLAPIARACGGLRAEAHFSRHLSPGGSAYRFIALHFDNIGCNDRSVICAQAGCLHQVYVSSGAGYRLVFDARVEDLELTMVGSAPAIKVHCAGFAPGCTRILHWTGTRFEDHPRGAGEPSLRPR